MVDQPLHYGQLLERKPNRKLAYTLARVLVGERRQLIQSLKQLGLSGLNQTAFIERVNLTIGQSVAPLTRKTWSLARSEPHLLIHLQW